MPQGHNRPYPLKTRPGHVATLKMPLERERRKLAKAYQAFEDEYEGLEYLARELVESVEPPLEHRGTLVRTGADVADCAPEDVLVELATEAFMEASLQPGEGKLSGGPSGSSSPESSTEGAGTAPTADGEAARAPEGAA